MALSEDGDPPPLTVDNLLPLFKKVRNPWWGERLDIPPAYVILCELGIGYAKPEEFRKQFSPDEDKALSASIEWWLRNDVTMVNWRILIHTLDRAKETELADSIRAYAEPLEDPSITAENVKRVMEGMKNLSAASQRFFVPIPIEEKIDDEFSSDDEKLSALASYVVATHPNFSWEEIAGNLYFFEDDRAVELVRSYLPKVSSPSLTVSNILEVVRTVSYDDLYTVFQVPYKTKAEIAAQYRTDDLRREALVSHVLQTHPCLTWKLLAFQLRAFKYNHAEAVVVTKYLKVHSLFSWCVNHVVRYYDFYQPLLPKLPQQLQTHIHHMWQYRRRRRREPMY